jgi:glycerol-3-phosphate acyltransferase PlsY
MMEIKIILVMIFSYLLGSLPSAVIVSHLVKGVDIRELGDGNMGARNTFRNLGFLPGLVVGLADGSKGALSVLIARWLGLTPFWQASSGVFALTGHDYPIYVKFRGGQGLATIMGIFLALFPTQTALGLVVYGTIYLITRLSDLSAGIGCGLIFVMLVLQRNWTFAVFVALVFITIPIRKVILDHQQKARVYAEEKLEDQKRAAPYVVHPDSWTKLR